MNIKHTQPPQIPLRIWKIAAVTGAGAFMAMVDSTVANLALEAIQSDLMTSLATVQWVATAYLCALAVSLPAAGWLGKRFGFGRIWALSLGCFVVTSASCALATTPTMLIAARILQGFAGGIMVPAGQAIISITVAKNQLGRIMGTLGLVVALGPAIGPGIGGYLLDMSSWRWLFWINVPVGLLALMFARGLIASGERDHSLVFNRTGFVLLAGGLSTLLYGATEMGLSGPSPLILTAITAGFGLTVVFIVITVRGSNPLIELHLFNRRIFSAATFTAGLTGANMYAGFLFLPLYLQLVLGQSATVAGMMLLVMGLGSALVLPVGGVLTDRYGAAPVSLTGAGLLLLSTIPFLFSADFSIPFLISILLVRGVGVALAQMPAMTAAYISVSSIEMGDATTLVNIVQRVGGAVGAVSVVIILQQAGGSENFSAYLQVFFGLTLLSALTLAAAIAMKDKSGGGEGRGTPII